MVCLLLANSATIKQSVFIAADFSELGDLPNEWNVLFTISRASIGCSLKLIISVCGQISDLQEFEYLVGDVYFAKIWVSRGKGDRYRGEKAAVCVHVHRKRQTLSYLMRPAHSGWQFAARLNVNPNQNPHGNADKTVWLNIWVPSNPVKLTYIN